MHLTLLYVSLLHLPIDASLIDHATSGVTGGRCHRYTCLSCYGMADSSGYVFDHHQSLRRHCIRVYDDCQYYCFKRFFDFEC